MLLLIFQAIIASITIRISAAVNHLTTFMEERKEKPAGFGGILFSRPRFGGDVAGWFVRTR